MAAPADRILPDIGNRDKLGSLQEPWQEGHFVQLFIDGKEVASRPIDADWITEGLLTPNVIATLLAATEIFGSGLTLGDIAADAILGGTDPVARINAGGTEIDGSKIAPGSLDGAAFGSALAAMTAIVALANGAAFQTDDFAPNNGNSAAGVGWRLDWSAPQFNRGVWNGITIGKIDCGSLHIDQQGNLHISDGANSGSLWMDHIGRQWFGALAYADAPLQIDSFGNFYLLDTPQSLSSIDLGAINAVVKEVFASPSGGSVDDGALVTLSPKTRGATIYYTTDGTAPTLASTVYTAPFAVHPPQTVKAIAVKLGVVGPVTTLDFTLLGGGSDKVSDPNFNPIGGYFYTQDGTLDLNLSCATAGATIRYTLDGSDPTSGIIYVGPINLPQGTTRVRAIGSNAGMDSSNIVEQTYTVNVGTGFGGPGGGGPYLGGGGHLPQ